MSTPAPTPDAAPPEAGRVRLTAFVHGRVQGVGFRWWTRRRALELGLLGSVANLDDGRVQVVAEGPEPACQALLQAISDAQAAPGQVRHVAHRWGPAKGGLTGFLER